LIGFSIDISEQKRAEQALRDSEARERARALELEGILDALPLAMFIARDPEARNIAGSRMTYEMLRLPPGSNISSLQSEDFLPNHAGWTGSIIPRSSCSKGSFDRSDNQGLRL
jgi:PAS domain-containing protein